jgi:two-component system sensor histidine kinase RegB
MLSRLQNSIPQALEKDAAAHGLSWLLRLRWMAILGQVLTCVVVAGLMNVRLPLIALGLCVSVSLVTNTLITWLRNRITWSASRIVFILLIIDTATLTAMLYLAGGAHNPFSIFYLLHIAIAALLLPGFAVWFILGESILGFMTLFLSPYELHCQIGGIGFLTFDLHLQGMLIALALCGGFLAYFVSRLGQDLQLAHSKLEKARVRSERSRLVSAMGTLAAGAAHELATPLATIAIASKELTKQGDEMQHSADFREDALLICSQVQRCQTILQKLNLDALRRGEWLDEPTCIRDIPELLKSHFTDCEFQRLHFQGFEERSIVQCAREPFLQSLRSLIHNALLASKVSDRVDIQLQRNKGELVFSVSDHGVGMDEEMLEKVGDPFFTTRPPGEGLGLGIFLARMFCESVEGELAHRRRSDGGIVASLSIPIAKTAAL